MVNSSEVSLDLLIIPIRDLYEAAESRRRVTRLGNFYGGMWGNFSLIPGVQENLLSKKLYKLLYFASSASVPIIFLQFPKFGKDKDYLYSNLKNFFEDSKIDYHKFSTAFDKMYRADRIHKFSSSANIIQTLCDLYLSIVLIIRNCIYQLRINLKIGQRMKRLLNRK
ncbi:hypothetical protein SynA1562_01776 [Synechococcus sp. A15-62]|nr:hypothetical protein SynA1562_01776 [Synechococcus sp. A15-62]